jgi:hypothetical protein
MSWLPPWVSVAIYAVASSAGASAPQENVCAALRVSVPFTEFSKALARGRPPLSVKLADAR